MLFTSTNLSCQTSGRAEPQISLDLLLPQDLSLLLPCWNICWGFRAEAMWELWDGAWRDKEHSSPWRKVMAQGWSWNSWPMTASVCCAQFLCSNNYFWLRRTYQRMQLSSAVGDLCEFPSPPSGHNVGFHKRSMSFNCETWDPANAQRNKISLETTNRLPYHEV